MIARRRGVARSAVRLAAGTAVMAGTAGAIHHRQEQRWANQQAEQDAQYQDAQNQAQMEQMQQQMAMQQQIQQMQAQQAPPAAAPAPAAPAGGTDLNSQLMQLAQLHNAGVLNDEEFAQAKAKLLSGG